MIPLLTLIPRHLKLLYQESCASAERHFPIVYILCYIPAMDMLWHYAPYGQCTMTMQINVIIKWLHLFIEYRSKAVILTQKVEN